MSNNTYILSVLTPDRPGIIANISQLLCEHHVVMRELSQTVVRNYFTVIVVIDLPESLNDKVLLEAMQNNAGDNARVTLIKVQEPTKAKQNTEVFILTLVGENDAHVLPALTAVLADAGGNILDLSVQLNNDGMQIIAEVQLPIHCAVDQLQIDLQHASENDETLQVRLQHQRLFQATNEVAFRRIDHV